MSSNTAVELKGSMYTFLSLKLHATDPAIIGDALADKVQQAPGFFRNTPVVVDLTGIEQEPDLDLVAIIETIRKHKLVPVIASMHDRESAMANSLDIPVVEAGTREQKSPKSETEQNKQDDKDGELNTATDETGEKSAKDTDTESESTSPAKPAAADLDPIDLAMTGTEIEYITRQPKLVTRPVRSGQQVYARDTDLIVIGQVGPGAEVLADNNIHVYGPLRGRALCGVTGNKDARIFCQSLEAELVSIAGIYKVLEDDSEAFRGKPAQIRVADEKIIIEGL